MADNNVFNDKDTMDINELAALNDDISPELIEQLQQKLTQEASTLNPEFNEQDDTTLFEETGVEGANNANNAKSAESAEVAEGAEGEAAEPKPEKKQQVNIDKNFDDNFIKKYKAKLNKQDKDNVENTISAAAFSAEIPEEEKKEEEPISKVSGGKIVEKAITKEQKSYNDSLDFLDGNVKYSKYVIYIDPQNVNFIESLTVKERKNLINSILRQQDDIKITKQRFKVVQTVIKHIIVAILTVTISIPVIYLTINASLEATINNHRRSQTNWQVLYRDHGKINKN